MNENLHVITLILFVLKFSNKLCTLCMKTLQGREGFKSMINQTKHQVRF
jgi:hypothetical protein